MDESVSHVREHPDLKRGIGPWLLLFFILGDIVGAGIYALVGEVGGLVGQPLSLSLEDLVSRPAVTRAVTMECAGNGRARYEPHIV